MQEPHFLVRCQASDIVRIVATTFVALEREIEGLGSVA
jgi:hypothetical protein